eukprot:4597533-Pleurochrysis_carterae.AAC.1
MPVPSALYMRMGASVLLGVCDAGKAFEAIRASASATGSCADTTRSQDGSSGEEEPEHRGRTRAKHTSSNASSWLAPDLDLSAICSAAKPAHEREGEGEVERKRGNGGEGYIDIDTK